MINLHLDTDIRTLPPEEARKKIDGINQVAEHFCKMKFYDECKYCAENALNMAEAVQYTKGIAGAKYNLGWISFLKKDYQEAIHVFSESEKLYEQTDDSKSSGKVCHKLASAYRNLGDYSSEIEFFFKAVNFFRESEQRFNEANTLNSIGNYYLETGEYDSALEYYKMSLNLKKKLPDIRGIIMTLYNIALTMNNYASEKISSDDTEGKRLMYEKALKYYSASLDFNAKFDQDPFLENRIMQNVGLTYSNLGRLEEAVSIFNKCILYFTEVNIEEDKCDTLSYLAMTFVEMKKFDEAEKTLIEAKKIAESVGLKRLSFGVYREFAKLYEHTKDFKKALYYKKEYTNLDFERNKTLIEDNIRKLNILHRVDITKKETEILTVKNEQLKSINHELIKLNNEKNYFLNLAAKDLKQPLENIGDKLSVIKTSDADIQLKNLTEILEESHQMQGIISNLLVINESESVK